MVLTAFAPNDEAFDNFAAEQNITIGDLVDSAVIAPILQYHIVPFAVKATDLHPGQSLPTLMEGHNITIAMPPAVAAQSLGIEDFDFVTLTGEDNDALILNEDLQAGEVSRLDPCMHHCSSLSIFCGERIANACYICTA